MDMSSFQNECIVSEPELSVKGIEMFAGSERRHDRATARRALGHGPNRLPCETCRRSDGPPTSAASGSGCVKPVSFGH